MSIKLIKRILAVVAIIVALVSIWFFIEALINKKCNPVANILLASAIVVFSVETLIPDKKKEEAKEEKEAVKK